MRIELDKDSPGRRIRRHPGTATGSAVVDGVGSGNDPPRLLAAVAARPPAVRGLRGSRSAEPLGNRRNSPETTRERRRPVYPEVAGGSPMPVTRSFDGWHALRPPTAVARTRRPIFDTASPNSVPAHGEPPFPSDRSPRRPDADVRRFTPNILGGIVIVNNSNISGYGKDGNGVAVHRNVPFLRPRVRRETPPRRDVQTDRGRRMPVRRRRVPSNESLRVRGSGVALGRRRSAPSRP